MPVRPLGNPLIPYDTPLHVTELLLQILKITFEDLPEDFACPLCGVGKEDFSAEE